MLLACGVLAGPLFVVTVLAQACTRDGFDPARHPLSLLSLGTLGWVQITNFILTGLLVIASAVGIRKTLSGTRAGTWGPRLIGVYGAAMVWGGIFLADPADGFPPGAATSTDATWHGLLHNGAPTIGGLALDVACLVFARRFLTRRQTGWAAYCLVTVAADLSTAAAAAVTTDYRWLYLGGALIWGWASVVTAHVLAFNPDRRDDPA